MAIECKKDIVYEHLKREILGKLLSPGSRLPREVELAKRLKVGHVTLRSALARLAAEGLVERMPGKGTFVTEVSERNTVLLILPDGTDNLETPSRYIAAGIDAATAAKAVTLERCPASLWTSFSERECQEMIQQHKISGVLLETGHNTISTDLIARLKFLQLPVVIPHGLPQDAENTGFLVLRTDERTALSSALRYLKKLGHRAIATMLLELPSEQLTAVRGFTRNELREFYKYNDLKSDDFLIRFVPNQEDVMIQTVREWMLGPLPPTAIMCHSDRVAMRVYQALKELNILIPQQVSVVGYSNYPGSQLLRPSLTTIDIQFNKCGQMALDQLLQSEHWYQPGITPAEIFTPFEIIERGSVGSVKK
jgi:DNA-binding LacI/PurR family transcriptional regulator